MCMCQRDPEITLQYLEIYINTIATKAINTRTSARLKCILIPMKTVEFLADHYYEGYKNLVESMARNRYLTEEEEAKIEEVRLLAQGFIDNGFRIDGYLVKGTKTLDDQCLEDMV